jgi:hypothetical protein
MGKSCFIQTRPSRAPSAPTIISTQGEPSKTRYAAVLDAHLDPRVSDFTRAAACAAFAVFHGVRNTHGAQRPQIRRSGAGRSAEVHRAQRRQDRADNPAHVIQDLLGTRERTLGAGNCPSAVSKITCRKRWLAVGGIALRLTITTSAQDGSASGQVAQGEASPCRAHIPRSRMSSSTSR